MKPLLSPNHPSPAFNPILFSAQTHVDSLVGRQKGKSYQETLSKVLANLKPEFNDLDPILDSVSFTHQMTDAGYRNSNGPLAFIEMFFERPPSYSTETHVVLNFKSKLPAHTLPEKVMLSFNRQKMPWFSAYPKMRESVKALLSQIKASIEQFSIQEETARFQIQGKLEQRLEKEKATLLEAQTQRDQLLEKLETARLALALAETHEPLEPFGFAVEAQKNKLGQALLEKNTAETSLSSEVAKGETEGASPEEIARRAVVFEQAKQRCEAETRILKECEDAYQQKKRAMRGLEQDFEQAYFSFEPQMVKVQNLDSGIKSLQEALENVKALNKLSGRLVIPQEVVLVREKSYPRNNLRKHPHPANIAERHLMKQRASEYYAKFQTKVNSKD
ncbi:MAG: hypothetical protein K2X66_03430 [Cyanobacteria bacterium]|nr:hypothetical protein [Cyanobacteriota bacterium]